MTILRAVKGSDLARHAATEVIAVVDGATAAVEIVAATNGRVPRLARRPRNNVRHERNASPPRPRRLREVIPENVHAARDVEIVPGMIEVREKIGRVANVVLNGTIVVVMNLAEPRQPFRQP